MRDNRRGFTIVELLVVAAIVGILAAILWPTYTASHKQALKVSCLSNLRQIATAALSYAESNGDKLSPYATQSYIASDVTLVQGRPKSWVEAYLGRFGSFKHPLKSPEVFWCPDDPNKDPMHKNVRFKAWDDQPSDHRHWYTSYQTNPSYPAHRELIGPNGTLRLSLNNQIVLQLPYLVDATWYSSNELDSLRSGHGKRCNMVSLDTHAENVDSFTLP